MLRVKFLNIACILLSQLIICSALVDAKSSLIEKVKSKQWIHGQKDCSKDKQPAIDILQLTESTYIFRQNKCVHYEAPFIYLLLGKQKALLFDTGATSDVQRFPLHKTVRQTIESYQQQFQLAPLELIVAHSHSPF